MKVDYQTLDCTHQEGILSLVPSPRDDAMLASHTRGNCITASWLASHTQTEEFTISSLKSDITRERKNKVSVGCFFFPKKEK